MSERHKQLIVEAIKADKANQEGYKKEVSMASFGADVACREAHPYELLLAMHETPRYDLDGKCVGCGIPIITLAAGDSQPHRSSMRPNSDGSCPVERYEELTSE